MRGDRHIVDTSPCVIARHFASIGLNPLDKRPRLAMSQFGPLRLSARPPAGNAVVTTGRPTADGVTPETAITDRELLFSRRDFIFRSLPAGR